MSSFMSGAIQMQIYLCLFRFSWSVGLHILRMEVLLAQLVGVSSLEQTLHQSTQVGVVETEAALAHNVLKYLVNFAVAPEVIELRRHIESFLTPVLIKLKQCKAANVGPRNLKVNSKSCLSSSVTKINFPTSSSICSKDAPICRGLFFCIASLKHKKSGRVSSATRSFALSLSGSQAE